MTQDNRMPNFWWCPTHHLYRGGDKRPCADAVRLVPESAEHQQPRLTPKQWQAAVDRARDEREEALRADRHAEVTEAEASEARDG